jgi:hypothetical protein
MRVSFSPLTNAELPRFKGIGFSYEQHDQGNFFQRVIAVFKRVFSSKDEPQILEVQLDIDSPGFWKGTSPIYNGLRAPRDPLHPDIVGDPVIPPQDAFAVQMNVVRRIYKPEENSLFFRVLEQFLRFLSRKKEEVPLNVIFPENSLPSTMLQFANADQRVSYTVTHNRKEIPVTLILKGDDDVGPHEVMQIIHDRLHADFQAGKEPQFITPAAALTPEELNRLRVVEELRLQEMALAQQDLEEAHRENGGVAPPLQPQAPAPAAAEKAAPLVMPNNCRIERDEEGGCLYMTLGNEDPNDILPIVDEKGKNIEVIYSEGRRIHFPLGTFEDVGGNTAVFEGEPMVLGDDGAVVVAVRFKVTRPPRPDVLPAEEPLEPPKANKIVGDCKRFKIGGENALLIKLNGQNQQVRAAVDEAKKLIEVFGPDDELLARYPLGELEDFYAQTSVFDGEPAIKPQGGALVLTIKIKTTVVEKEAEAVHIAPPVVQAPVVAPAFVEPRVIRNKQGDFLRVTFRELDPQQAFILFSDDKKEINVWTKEGEEGIHLFTYNISQEETDAQTVIFEGEPKWRISRTETTLILQTKTTKK